MNRSCTITQKPFGYVKLTQSATADEIMFGKSGQSNLVGFYISIMIAIILVLDVVWPTIDSKINSGDANDSYSNLSSTAKTLIELFGLILALGLLIMMLRPIM